MSESDYWVDRRRMARKVVFWRVAAFAVALAAVIAAAFALADTAGFGNRAQAHIAKIDISGFITGDDKTIDLIKRVGESRARAVLVEINSPGGTVTGSEKLYDALRELSAKKPTVAVVGGMAASGGYVAALGTDRIVAQQTSLVGSIGVLFQIPNVVGLMDKVGVNMEIVKSSPLKASPNPFERTTPESQAALRALLDSSFDWFKTLVATRRGLDGDALNKVADGRVFTGVQGREVKLVDEIGSQKQAVAWLEQEKGLPKDLPVREWKREDDRSFGLFSAAASLAGAAGLHDVAAVLRALAASGQPPVLDGVLALWQP